MKIMEKSRVIKSKFLIQRFMVHSIVMCFLMATMVYGVIKITGDYKSIEVNGPNQYYVMVATDGAITSEVTDNITPTVTVTPVVTATPAATTTPTPIPDTRTQASVTLNYTNETMTITSKDSTRFYISQDKEKSWELVERPQSIDLSIFMKSSDNYIFIKGDKDEKVVEIKIPKPDSSLKISYVVEAGKGKLVFTNALGSLQYRKGTEGVWNVYQGSMDLADFEINGYTLQFRTMASVNARAGKVVTVKIPKRQSPPTIKEDYSKFTLSGMKAGVTEYRLAGSSTWIKFNPTDTKIKTLDLATLLQPGSSPNVIPIPAATIEFHNLGTDKKVASGVRVIRTLAQPIAPVATNVKLTANNLIFADASKDKPYEYIVLHTKEVVNLSNAKWKKVTTSKEITIKKVGTAVTVSGDVVYYRLASTKDSTTKAITPASMYGSVIITSVTIPQ